MKIGIDLFAFIRFIAIVHILLYSSLMANIIDIDSTDVKILNKSEIYIDKDLVTFEQIKKIDKFYKSKINYLNLGFSNKAHIWVRLTLKNSSNTKKTKILEITNSLLEKVVLHTDNKTQNMGMLHRAVGQTTINPYFEITLQPLEMRTIYLEVSNSTTSMKFGIDLKTQKSFLYDDYYHQVSIILFLGIILSLLIYNAMLYFFTKNSAFMHYASYLFALLFQQMTYLGISPIFFPYEIILIDNAAVIFKINSIFILAAVFAKSFLQTKNYRYINTIYNIFIFVGILEMPLVGTVWFYHPEVGVLTGLLFVVFNIYAGVYIYMKGYRQARFFVIGWGVLVFGFIVMILDALGAISVMHKYPNIIMYSTALEAFVLSLAFSDHYKILSKQKKEADDALMQNLSNAKSILNQAISVQTVELSTALDSNKTLLHELQHRIKNNLQLILSLIRLQLNNSDENIQGKLKKLIGRIHAISKTHDMLYTSSELEFIKMDNYISELCIDIEDSFSVDNIEFYIEAGETTMPFREASYIGLVINELVTNSIKYAKVDNLEIYIELTNHSNRYTLNIGDNGCGYDLNENKKNSMGLSLVRALIENQLDGQIKIQNKDGLLYMIEYKL